MLNLAHAQQPGRKAAHGERRPNLNQQLRLRGAHGVRRQEMAPEPVLPIKFVNGRRFRIFWMLDTPAWELRRVDERRPPIVEREKV
jgi:hypothetical protein